VNALTTLYRNRMALLQAWVLGWLGAYFALRYDRDDPVASLAIIGAAAASQIAHAQQMAAAETAAWLRASIAQATRTPPGQVAQLAVPPIAGTSAAGVPLGDMTALAPSVYLARIGNGWTPEDAGRAAGAWLDRLAASEPYRAANMTTLASARDDPRLTGRVRRETRPGACDFCRDIADDGYSPARAGFQALAHCQCTATPEIGGIR
jgi:hypothetical protein